MQKLIVIKYGELTTKKDNINLFLSTLKKNILNTLEEFNIKINYDQGRMFIRCNESDIESIIIKLKKVFGIHKIFIGYEINSIDLDIIKSKILELIKDKEFETFKIETKRSNKNIPYTSMEINSMLGELVLNNKNTKVDIHNPKVTIHLEIRNNYSYIYFANIEGLKGYPVGTLGKGVLMLSGGIDSPVAGFMTMKRGVKIEAIYFDSPPHTSLNAKNKVIELARIIGEYQGSIKLHVIHFTAIQEAIYKNIPNEYLITIMRRMMYRISEKIARNVNAKIIVNGESIGQVASQTLTSMNVINEVVKIPVIRPLACFDKLEIIEISKSINTYETSILPYQDCCTIFVPKHPVINPNLDLCKEYEKLIDYDTLISDAIKNEEIIKISSKKENKFSDLL